MRRRRGDEEDGELRGCREQPVRGNPDQPSVEASPSVFTMYNCWIVQYTDTDTDTGCPTTLDTWPFINIKGKVSSVVGHP